MPQQFLDNLILHPCSAILSPLMPQIMKVHVRYAPYPPSKCRTREPLHHGRDFLNTTRRASEGVETLEANQGEEDIDRLIEGFGSRSSVLLSKPLNNDTKTLPSPFVSCPYHMLKIWIEGG